MKYKTLATLLAAFSATAVLQPVAFAQESSSAVRVEKLGPAKPAAAPVQANRIESLEAVQKGGRQYVRIRMAHPLQTAPNSFSVAQPARIAFDFPATSNAIGRTTQDISLGNLKSASVVQVGDRTRVVLNVNRLGAYQSSIEGNDLVITLGSIQVADQMVAAAKYVPQSATAAAPEAALMGKSVVDVNFRRGQKGEGKVVVQLSEADTGVDVRRQGGGVVIEFPGTALPAELRRNFDVNDFATPVSSFRVQQVGKNTRISVKANGLWEHNAYQSNTQFVLEVKALKQDPQKMVHGLGGKEFGGEKLSLNFQDVDVRSVLQVIADFTDFNIVTSDSVQGNLTLRLQDVPWDQALDIILQAKGLDKRKNGNVIWIAPAEELAQRERVQLEAKAQVVDLEPLRTQIYQINYHKAKDVTDFLSRSTGGEGGGAARSALSKRGSVTYDEASNKLFVTDVSTKLIEIDDLVRQIDLPPRQVLIEARIVEATKSFARDLGVRLGLGMSGGNVVGYDGAGNPIRRATIGGPLGTTLPNAGQVINPGVGNIGSLTGDAITPGGLNVNLPAGVAQAGSLSMVLWNSAATRFLNLELSALESDGKGRVLSSPKVLTANQKEAMIQQGEEIPYQSVSDGEASIEFKEAVLELKVTPQITPDGRVNLDVAIKKDTAARDKVAPGQEPPINTRKLMSEVLVENGGTVVLGGVFEEQEANSVTKVPLLGDIPVLGNLFKSRVNKTEQRELLIFITPRIVNDELTLR